MMKKCMLLFLAVGLTLLFAGCASVPGGVAASNTPLHGKPFHVIGETRGTDSHYAILGIIPITSGNSVQAAVKKAQQRVGADALIEIYVDCYVQFWVLFTRTVTEVNAKGVRLQPKWEGDAPATR